MKGNHFTLGIFMLITQLAFNQCITNQTVSIAQTTMACPGSTTVSIPASEIGVTYSLRNNATNAVIGASQAGTGGALNFSTGTVSSNTTFQVFATKTSRALDFDGLDDYLSGSTSPVLDITGNLTIELWVNRTANMPDWQRLVGKGDMTYRTYGVWLSSGGQLLFQSYGPSGSMDLAGPIIPLNTWTHIACVRSGTQALIYVNGVLTNSTSYPTTVSYSSPLPLTVGYSGFHTLYRGRLDEIRIWNTLRSNSDIVNNMNTCLVGNEAGLVANYRMEDTPGSTIAADATANGLTEVLVNMDPGSDWQAGSTLNKIMNNTVTVTMISPTVDASTSPGSGNALQFNGSNGQAALGNFSITSNNQRTVEFWMNASTTGAFMNPFASGTATNGQTFNIKVTPTGHLGFMGFNDDNYPSSGRQIADGTWHHVAISYNGVTLTAYIDGIVEWTSNKNLNTVGSNNFLGRSNHAGAEQFYNGSLDEVRVWNVALTQTQIRDWMCTKLTNSYPSLCNLVACYRADGTSGTSLTDNRNAFDGTLSGGVTWITSGAPIGNESIWVQNPAIGASINLAHAHGDDMTATLTSGSAGLIMLYSVDQEPNFSLAPTPFNEISSVDYFGIKTFNQSGATYTATYNYQGHPGIADENTLGLAKRANNSVMGWTQQPTAVLNTTANTLVLAGQTGTEFILGSTSNNILPIELISFDAFQADRVVNLKWITASEVNNDYFTVQKTKDGLTWETVGTVDGAGTSTEVISYSLLDSNPYTEVSFYRLVQTDFDGTVVYSDWKSVALMSDQAISIYPNPTKDNIVVRLNDLNTTAQLSVSDAMGTILSSISTDQVLNKIELPNEQGIYFLRIEINQQVEIRKVIKN